MNISKTKLRKLRESLPISAVSTIAKRRKITPQYVRMVLRGESFRVDVIEDAIEIAAEEKKKSRKAEKAITQL